MKYTIGYFGTLGIDPFAFQDLFTESVDAREKIIEYSGYYPFVADNETELLSALNMRNEQEDLYDAISTDFGFDISYSIWDGHVSLFFSNSIGCDLEDWYREYEERKMNDEETLPHK